MSQTSKLSDREIPSDKNTTQKNGISDKDDARHIAVLGGGSFGTAITKVLAENGHHVRFWMRDSAQAKEIQKTRINSRYMPDITLEGDIQPTSDMAKAISGASAVFVAIPSTAFRRVIHENAAVFGKEQAVVSLTKGIEKDGFRLMSEVLMEELPRCRIGVLSGPNLAAEIVNQDLTATVIAAKDPGLRRDVQKLLGCEYFRVYANIDVYGAELAGALKNIYAIVAGLASALDMGENAKAMLITRSLAEMSRFAVTMGANPMTFMGLSGVGDLIVTCTSSKSRNFRIGQAVGQGRSLEDAARELGQVAEGVHTLCLVRDKAAEIGIYMPLVNGLYDILYKGASINAVIKGLMMAVQNSDVEFILPRTVAE